MKKILCYIGAKGKSRRLEYKNLSHYGDKTLIEHALINALKSKYIDDIIFDSEDEKILDHVRRFQKKWDDNNFYNKPFIEIHKRKPGLSEGEVSLYKPVRAVLNENFGYPIVVILQVDNPVADVSIIDKCIKTYLDHDDAEDVSTFHNGRRTGTVRVINRRFFFDDVPTANIYSIEDRLDFVDIHTEKDLKQAVENLKNKPHHDTFQVQNKIKEPLRYNTKTVYNHFSRYSKAIDSLKINKTDSVIDASCGQGYGTYLLSLHCNNVWGIDINKDHLKKAEEFYKTDNISFLTYPEFNFPNATFIVDKIVCIETIEHIAKEAQQVFIEYLLNHLTKGGNMFITAPLGKNKKSTYNDFHLSEPSFDHLKSLLISLFDNVEVVIDVFVNSFGYETEYCMMSLYGYKKDEDVTYLSSNVQKEMTWEEKYDSGKGMLI